MLSVRLVRSNITATGCRSFGRTKSLAVSADETSKTPASSDDAVSQPLNIFGQPEGLTEEEITAKRNIARMSSRMYNRKIRGVYDKPIHNDFLPKQLRKDFVTYGETTGINAGVCWPTKQEMADLHFIDSEFYSTFAQLKERIEDKRKRADEVVDAREKEIEANLARLVDWRKDMLDKEEKKRKSELEKKAVMDERIREVREYIGYNVEPSDPKFIEVMEMKEEERKKAAKEARKIAKQERTMQKLMAFDTTTNQQDDAKTKTAEEQTASRKQNPPATDSAAPKSSADDEKATTVDGEPPAGKK